MTPTAQRIFDALQQYRFSFRNERIFQDHFEQMLNECSIPNVREFQLSKADRPDFMINISPTNGDAAIDLKIAGPINAHLRQLKRYADHDVVRETILIATRPFDVPATLSGKPCHCLTVRML